MLCMADPDDFNCPEDCFLYFKLLIHWVGKHHIKKIFYVSEIFFREDNGQSCGCPVGICSKGWHFSDEFDGHLISIFGIEKIIRVKEGGEGSDHSHHDGHWMSFASESFIKFNHFFVDHHFTYNCFLKSGEFLT